MKLVFTNKQGHLRAFVFALTMEGQYLLELLDSDTGDTIRDVRFKGTETEAIDKVKQWMQTI